MYTSMKQASALVRIMTVEEKIAQLVSAWLEIAVDGSFTVR